MFNGKYKKAPNRLTFESFKDANDTQVERDGKYYPARWCGMDSLKSRIELAWAVFTGKADAFFWPGGQ